MKKNVFFKDFQPSRKVTIKKWTEIPIYEIWRLERTLANHLRKMGAKFTKTERHDFVIKVLESQKGTCAFADGNPMYCWNNPRDEPLHYLKLQWGHKNPSSRVKWHTPDDLYLQCARCNNQLQTSRAIFELINELEHKIKALKKLRGD